MTSAPNIQLRNGTTDARWLMDLEDMPDTQLHASIIQLLLLVLDHRFRDRNALVTTNLPCRWEPEDERVGVNPDVILVEPAPPGGETMAIESLRVWLPDHPPPKLAVEVVSKTNPEKDYKEGPARLSRLGAEELWIFDPDLHGPPLDELGGPFVLQIWRRPDTGGPMQRIHAGDTPAHSPVLDAWVVTTNDGKQLRIADDADGTRMWPTRGEAAEERAVAEAKARKAETETRKAETARADAAEAELRRLRAQLSKES